VPVETDPETETHRRGRSTRSYAPLPAPHRRPGCGTGSRNPWSAPQGNVGPARRLGGRALSCPPFAGEPPRGAQGLPPREAGSWRAPPGAPAPAPRRRVAVVYGGWFLPRALHHAAGRARAAPRTSRARRRRRCAIPKPAGAARDRLRRSPRRHRRRGRATRSTSVPTTLWPTSRSACAADWTTRSAEFRRHGLSASKAEPTEMSLCEFADRAGEDLARRVTSSPSRRAPGARATCAIGGRIAPARLGATQPLAGRLSQNAH
jgi:hypothetical protein